MFRLKFTFLNFKSRHTSLVHRSNRWKVSENLQKKFPRVQWTQTKAHQLFGRLQNKIAFARQTSYRVWNVRKHRQLGSSRPEIFRRARKKRVDVVTARLTPVQMRWLTKEAPKVAIEKRWWLRSITHAYSDLIKAGRVICIYEEGEDKEYLL